MYIFKENVTPQKLKLNLAKPKARKPKRDVRNEEGTQMIKTENVGKFILFF